jgi:hypothetical protein
MVKNVRKYRVFDTNLTLTGLWGGSQMQTDQIRIRNHERKGLSSSLRVITGAAKRYDSTRRRNRQERICQGKPPGTTDTTSAALSRAA